MKIRWTSRASADLVRLHEHLRPVAPKSATRVIQTLAKAPHRLLVHPRIGEKLAAYDPRDVRRILIGDYELRYEVSGDAIPVLRLWHCRESRQETQD